MTDIEILSQAIRGLVEQGRYESLPTGLKFKVAGIVAPISLVSYIEKVKTQPGFCRIEYTKHFKREWNEGLPNDFYAIKLAYYIQLLYYLANKISITPKIKTKTLAILKANGPDELTKVSQFLITKSNEDRVKGRTTRVKVEDRYSGMSRADIWRIYCKGTDEEKSKIRKYLRQKSTNIKGLKNEFKNCKTSSGPGTQPARVKDSNTEDNRASVSAQDRGIRKRNRRDRKSRKDK
jgi:hypothetical protein